MYSQATALSLMSSKLLALAAASGRPPKYHAGSLILGPHTSLASFSAAASLLSGQAMHKFDHATVRTAIAQRFRAIPMKTHRNGHQAWTASSMPASNTPFDNARTMTCPRKAPTVLIRDNFYFSGRLLTLGRSKCRETFTDCRSAYRSCVLFSRRLLTLGRSNCREALVVAQRFFVEARRKWPRNGAQNACFTFAG
jgi:hypothetical protein